MSLEIIPTLELRGGQALRASRGASGTEVKVAADALKIAKQFVEAGATRLHLIDLDGQRMGSPQHLVLARDIARRTGVPVQFSGGIRTIELAERLLNGGVDRIVIGTMASRDTTMMIELLHRHPEKVIVAVDHRNGQLVIEGGMLPSTENAAAFALRMTQMGASRFQLTGISENGFPETIHAATVASFAKLTDMPTVAAGEITGIDDIKNLAQVQPEGVESVLVGRALYIGALKLDEAIAVAAAGVNSVPVEAPAPVAPRTVPQYYGYGPTNVPPRRG